MRFAILFIFLFPSFVQAQVRSRAESASLRRTSASVGERVITRYAKPLKVGDKIVDEGVAFRVYRVTQAKGAWLWLESDSISGWADARDVVPYSQAVDHFTRQISLGRKTASAYICRGIVRHANGEYDAAVADYDEALRLDPKLALAYYNRGLACQKQRRYEQAIIDYSEAIVADPKYALAYRARGSAWHAKRDYANAIADYDEALRLEPEHALAHSNRALAWYAMHEYDRALADCDKAIRLAPTHPHSYNHRASIWCKKGRYEQAITDYYEAVRLAPDDPLACHNLAWLRATCPDVRHRDGKRAVEYATRACKLTRWSDWRLVHTLAAACAEAGDFDEAVQHGARAMALAPPEHKSRSREALEAYKSRKPHREQAIDAQDSR